MEISERAISRFSQMVQTDHGQSARSGLDHDLGAGEIAYAASFIEWFAEEGRRVYGDVTSCAFEPSLPLRVEKRQFRGDLAME
jgi:acyl-CoA reductase-like NAD-dependent aldehyde dehydrogenase